MRRNKERHVRRVLSMYLDGQARNPERVRRHLERCASCAGYLRELEHLREALGNLPQPAPRHAFAQRTAARAQEAGPARRRVWRVWGPVLASAGLMLLVGAFVLWQGPERPRGDTPAETGSLAGTPGPGDADTVSWNEDEAVLAAFDALAAGGVSLELFSGEGMTGTAHFEGEAAELMLEALVLAAAEDVYSGVDWGQWDDIDVFEELNGGNLQSLELWLGDPDNGGQDS